MSFSARTLALSAQQFELLTMSPVDEQQVAALSGSLSAHPPRLTAEILSTKRVPPGAGVSYGHTYRTPTATTLALVSIGYGHGVPRKAGNRASVTWGEKGIRLPIVGRVAMDVLMVDAGDAPVAVGESVVFFGDPESAEFSLVDWSDSIGEHPFSILASLDARVARVVTG